MGNGNGTYCPTTWAIVEIRTNNDKYHRILAYFAGSRLTDPGYWKLSSAISKVEKTNMGYRFINESGSVYVCDAMDQGLSNMTIPVYENLKNTKNISAELVDASQVLNTMNL